jgi:HEAT repeat protein
VEKVIDRIGSKNQRHAVRKILPLANSPSRLRTRLADIVPPELLVDGARWLIDDGSPVPERATERVEEIADSAGVDPRTARRKSLVVSAETLRTARELRDILRPQVVVDPTIGAPSESAFHRSDELQGLCGGQKVRAELAEALGDHGLRRHSELILLSIPSLWPDSPLARLAEERLVQRYFQRIELGEFRQAAEIVRDLGSVAGGSRILELAGPEGLDALLDALEVWGKEHRNEVAQVAVTLGVRLIPTILEALGSEEQLSRRRRMLEMALAIGKPALPYLRGKLEDERWFVVRNAVFLMRRLEDPDLSTTLSGLIDHDEPKVVAEVITALAGAGDTKWAVAFRRLFDRKDEASRREALTVASHLQHPELGRFLVKRLKKKGMLHIRDQETLDMIGVLGNYSEPEVIEELSRLASLPGWRYPFRLTHLWEAVAKAAARLSSPAGDQILTKIASQKDPSAELAAELLERRRENPS